MYSNFSSTQKVVPNDKIKNLYDGLATYQNRQIPSCLVSQLSWGVQSDPLLIILHFPCRLVEHRSRQQFIRETQPASELRLAMLPFGLLFHRLAKLNFFALRAIAAANPRCICFGDALHQHGSSEGVVES